MAKKDKASPTRLKVTKEKPRVNLQSYEWYPAEFVKAEVGDSKFGGQYLRLQFKILEGVCGDGETDAEGTLTSALCDADITQGSKSYDFVAGILGRDPDLKEVLDISPYYGDTYEVNIVTEKKKGQEKAHSNVVAIRSKKKTKKKVKKDTTVGKKSSKETSLKKSKKSKKSKK